MPVGHSINSGRILVLTLRRLSCVLLVGVCLAVGGQAIAEVEQAEAVIHAFTSREQVESDVVKISDKKKHTILFAMGIALLIFIITTAVLGISMVLFGKQVFVAHMIFAGFSVFLAIAHAVVAIVWFFPF
ncbi:MAG: hypothetical protein FD165_2547 [Gammaproteobacteria bacterium]|nr:MAG: hypothetical protein FD165_2547 [Gammaproteobacteria bacterium]TND02975.1 MAG: hypothetical protein FD120_2044 [Gammaproteobacteria bacterium]